MIDCPAKSGEDGAFVRCVVEASDGITRRAFWDTIKQQSSQRSISFTTCNFSDSTTSTEFARTPIVVVNAIAVFVAGVNAARPATFDQRVSFYQNFLNFRICHSGEV